jgi:hypothetical protein
VKTSPLTGPGPGGPMLADSLRIGSDGLDLAVISVLQALLAWCADFSWHTPRSWPRHASAFPASSP